jgi:hypothetical protein
VTRARRGDLAGRRVDGDVKHRDELSRLDLFDDDLVRVRQEVRGFRVLPRERPEAELRHCHVGGCLDPLAEHVADDDREPALVEGEEVVDVPAHVDAGRRLVDVADVEPGGGGEGARQERALHRLREVLLLLVETRVVDCEGGLGRHRHGRFNRLVPERPGWVEREEGDCAEHLPGGCEREDGGGRPLLEERLQKDVDVLGASRARPEEDGSFGAQEPARQRRAHRLRAGEHRLHGAAHLRIRDVHGSRCEDVPALVRHPDRCSVEPEELDDGLDHGLERRLEREALREGVRDVVEAAELARRPAFGLEGPFENLSELLRLFVQASVLDRDRELAREGDQKPLLPLSVRPRMLLEDREGADHLLVGDERDEERPTNAALLQLRLEPGKPRVLRHVLDEEVAAASKRPEGNLEQALGEVGRVRAREPA